MLSARASPHLLTSRSRSEPPCGGVTVEGLRRGAEGAAQSPCPDGPCWPPQASEGPSVESGRRKAGREGACLPLMKFDI